MKQQVLLRSSTEHEGVYYAASCSQQKRLVDFMHAANLQHIHPRVTRNGEHRHRILNGIDMDNQHYLGQQSGETEFLVVVTPQQQDIPHVSAHAAVAWKSGIKLRFIRTARYRMDDRGEGVLDVGLEVIVGRGSDPSQEHHCYQSPTITMTLSEREPFARFIFRGDRGLFALYL